MKKKLGDFTIKELVKIHREECHNKPNCEDCPLCELTECNLVEFEDVLDYEYEVEEECQKS